MTQNKFDELWQRAEAESYSQQLALEYPIWQQKQRKRTVVATFVVVLVVTVLLFTSHLHQPQNYEKVYCNRVGTTDIQWANLAAEMLIE